MTGTKKKRTHKKCSIVANIYLSLFMFMTYCFITFCLCCIIESRFWLNHALVILDNRIIRKLPFLCWGDVLIKYIWKKYNTPLTSVWLLLTVIFCATTLIFSFSRALSSPQRTGSFTTTHKIIAELSDVSTLMWKSNNYSICAQQ